MESRTKPGKFYSVDLNRFECECPATRVCIHLKELCARVADGTLKDKGQEGVNHHTLNPDGF